MHSGVGLLTMGVPQCAYLVLQVGLPEAMVTSDEKRNKLATIMPNYSSYQAVGIGPGIGTEKSTRQWLLHQLLVIQCPLVLDADALNAIAYEEKWQCIPKNSILTPHPKEFDRLFGLCQNSQERMLKAIQIAKELTFKKKLGLLGFECRCKKQFCAAHRAAEEHACEYDFKSDAKKELLKYMSSPVQAAKVAVI
jgi:NAD(P)H-hydrate repair Nnr-like enzyme with NAD(P)H-hydrate dehydratase domain